MASSQIPGPLGIGANQPAIDSGTQARTNSQTPGPLGLSTPSSVTTSTPLDEDTRILAATIYGEASTKDIFEEMAAIGNVLVRQQKARSYTSIGTFIKTDKTYAFAAHDGNGRYKKLMNATENDINKSWGMATAIRAARNALSPSGTDYSNGAFFWDGADIKSNYDRHPKVLAGIHIMDETHNIYDIKSKNVPGEQWWLDSKGKKTKLRGKWSYKYESTAAYGGTIFWKYNADFLKATGNKEYN